MHDKYQPDLSRSGIGGIAETNLDNEIQAALALLLVPLATPGVITRLLEYCGCFRSVVTALCEPGADNVLFQQATPAKRENLKEIGRQLGRARSQAQKLREQLAGQGIVTLPVTSDSYPQLLREISTPPPVLFISGDPTVIHLPQLGIIGSRNSSRPGRDLAKSFARQLAASGLAITSGMALGIDGAAHQGALASGKTIAVLGTGLDILYPKAHCQLREQILETGGALVSEFLPGTPPRPQHFPRRNRIISGMSMGVLVVEAALKSGSLITARYALNQGREVFAIPGSVHSPLSKGCHQLIREGATLVETSADIVGELGPLLGLKLDEIDSAGSATNRRVQPVADIEECPLLREMGFAPSAIDDLIERTGLSAAEINSRLLELEMNGVISNERGIVTRLRN